jgi:hypothetical protein
VGNRLKWGRRVAENIRNNPQNRNSHLSTKIPGLRIETGGTPHIKESRVPQVSILRPGIPDSSVLNQGLKVGRHPRKQVTRMRRLVYTCAFEGSHDFIRIAAWVSSGFSIRCGGDSI